MRPMWTPAQGEHYRLEMHRHAEEKGELQARIVAALTALEVDSEWSDGRLWDAIGQAISHLRPPDVA